VYLRDSPHASRVTVTYLRFSKAAEPLLRVAAMTSDWWHPLHWLKAIVSTDYRGREKALFAARFRQLCGADSGPARPAG